MCVKNFDTSDVTRFDDCTLNGDVVSLRHEYQGCEQIPKLHSVQGVHGAVVGMLSTFHVPEMNRMHV